MPNVAWDGVPIPTERANLVSRTAADVRAKSLASGESRITDNGIGFGSGTLSGTVTVRGAIQAGAIVLLFDELTGQYVNSTVSDGSGIFTFTGLPDRQFFMVFKEPTGLWEYRVSSRRTPVV